MKKLLLLIVILFTLTSLFVVAEIQKGQKAFYPREGSDKPKDGTYSIYHQQLYTIVNGATCDTYPSLSDYTSGGFFYYCPTSNNNKGCSIDLWKGNYLSYVSQIHINAGQGYQIAADRTYEAYLCSQTSFLCGAEYDAGCGYLQCPSQQMGRGRTCTPPYADDWLEGPNGISYTCVDRAICVTTGGTTGGGGCTSHDTARCQDGNIYWVDSCGKTEEIKINCDNGCDTGTNTCSQPLSNISDIQLTYIDLPRNIVNPGTEVSVIFKVKNFGTGIGTSNVELTIIHESAFVGLIGVAPDLLSLYGREGISEIQSCKNEGSFIQAAKIGPLNKGEEKTFVMAALAPTQGQKTKTGVDVFGLGKGYAIIGLYQECGAGYRTSTGAIGVNKAFMFEELTIQTAPTLSHRELIGNSCVLVDGAGIDECTGDLSPNATLDLCNQPNGAECRLKNLRGGTDDSQQSDKCKSGWCADTRDYVTTGTPLDLFLADYGRCADAGLKGDLKTKIDGAEPHPTCVALGTVSECGSFIKSLAFFDITDNECSDGYIILFGGIMTLLLLVGILAKR